MNTICEDILKLLGKKTYVPMTVQEITLELGLDRKGFISVRKAISTLLSDGSIAKIKGQRYLLPQDVGLITGEISFKRNGSALIEANGKRYLVNRENTSVALHKDKVLARIVTRDKHFRRDRFRDGDELQAKVIKIIEKNCQTVIGTLRKSLRAWHLVPDDPRFYYDVILLDPKKSGLNPTPKENDKVEVRLDEWEQKHLNPTGKIIECFGASHTPYSEYKAILRKYDLDEDFEEVIKAQVREIPSFVSEDDVKGRQDLRGVFTVTIDPLDAKDFDDALSFRKIGNISEIGVHIADVSYYIKENSPLDKEARRRGNSTYLTGTVIPMLPFELSNGVCSLVENEDRLTKSVFLSFDAKGDCVGVKFANTVIRSNHRLSYEQAHAFLTSDDFEEIKKITLPVDSKDRAGQVPMADLTEKQLVQLRVFIRHMWSMALQLRKRRMKKGSLDLEMPEVKIFCNDEGYATSVEKVIHNESHQLVEEYMLAANEAVARILNEAKIPFVSRVHDDPDVEKLEELAIDLETFSLKCGDLTQRKHVTFLLKQIDRHPQNYLLKTKFLRSLKRAEYRASPDGHYGLFKQFYAHFTSPIRRYADYCNHRNLDFYLQLAKLPTAPKQKKKLLSKGALDSIAEHISRTERNSVEAERETKKLKLMEYFEEQSGKDTYFDAIITQIGNNGLFVELTDSMSFGFVHVHSLENDIYKINKAGNALVGRRTKTQYKIGSKISIRVESVDRFKRQIDFSL
ncbi:MAG: RNB domain-containing ribonuclease [Opitutales bacterium]